MAYSTTPQIPTSSQQLLLVTTQDWHTPKGWLQRYQRNGSGSDWQPVGKAIEVVVGEKGLAWRGDIEPITENQDLIKSEGDMRTPIGVFRIGPAFGFPSVVQNMQIPYQPLMESTICVDDSESRYYNQMIDAGKITHPDWHSAERMHTIPQYELGAVIQYNTAKPIPKAGSCIFMHIWRSPTSGTHGCVAMEKENLRVVLTWLDPEKEPVIGIFPEQMKPADGIKKDKNLF